MITHLPVVYPVVEVERDGRDEHPMRRVTREVAFDEGWGADRRDKVAALFDSMAATWHTDHDHPGRYLPLVDALERGSVESGHAVELGAGTGLGSRHLVGRFSSLVLADLSGAMLAELDPNLGPRVQLDAAHLPFSDGAVDVHVLNNMLLFPDEISRTLRTGGCVVWINTVGEQTPIHLSVEEVVAALPGQWTGVASRADRGLWGVLRRE
ncbi:MAG: class I SAM-dependent methyltransferase [Acidimicrobiales bacterium]